ALAGFPALLHGMTDGFRYVGTEESGLGYPAVSILCVAVTAGWALLPGSMIFPFTVALAGAEGGEAIGTARGSGAQLGRLLAANTCGAIAGALFSPFVLLPLTGLWGAFLTLSFFYALPAIFLRDSRLLSRRSREVLLAIGWIALLSLASPLSYPLTTLGPDERLLDQHSSAAGLVSVVEKAGERLIRTDNHYALGGSAERIHQERQGHLPLLLHAAPRHVAFIGAATGITAGAALAHPVEEIDLVELVPSIASAARDFFSDSNRGIYADPRTRVVIDDARNFVRASAERFDVVVADLFVPWRSGTGALYTLEHFQAVRDHLAPDGLFCQWLPLYQLDEEEFRIIAATFVDVFPRSALFRGDFFGAFPIVALVGWEGRPPAPDRVHASIARFAAAGERDRWMTTPLGFWALYAGPLSALATRTVDRNTDDRPRIEFLAARGHAGGGRGKLDPLVGLAWRRFEEPLRRAVRKGEDPVFPDLPAAARRAAEGGGLLQYAGALYAMGRPRDSLQALSLAAARLPARLVAEGEADPSAAEVWYPDR
ncbi:MAG: hypothetical protein V3T33_10000, partial [Myxococcota bacterium]